MNTSVELPLAEPFYSTYHFQTPGLCVAVRNPSLRNLYLNQIMEFSCGKRFRLGYTTPDLSIVDSSWETNPFLEKHPYDMRFLHGYVHPVIREMLRSGYYVFFSGVDDYYIKGKSWYGKRHFSHDGMICGFDQLSRTYSVYAYDSSWVYRRFKTPQSGFDRGRERILRTGQHCQICGIKAKDAIVEFSAATAVQNIAKYLHTPDRKHADDDNMVYGSIVQTYISEYIGKLYDGSIPYERMDYRILRLIWEQKKGMLERIGCIEKALGWNTELSGRYAPLVQQINLLRLLYAAHHRKRKDSVLPVIQKKLSEVKDAEDVILERLVDRAGGAV